MNRDEDAAQPDGQSRYSRAELARLCDVRPRLLAGWMEHGLLERRGFGDGRNYDFRDLLRARSLARLCGQGWTARRLAAAVEALRPQVPDLDTLLAGLLPPARTIAVRLPDGRLCTATGQGLFDFETQPRAVHHLRRPQDWFQLGVEAESEGRLADAARNYERALPGFGTAAWFNLGNCRYQLEDLDGAAQAFAAAVELDAEFADAWNNLGVVRGRLRQREAAMEAFRKVLALVPHYADAHYNLADLLAESGQLDEARAHWRAYLKYDPNSRWADRVRALLQE